MILIWILSKSYVHRLYIKDGNSHRAEHFSHCHLVFFNYYFTYTFYDLRVTTLHTHPVTNCQSQDGLTLNQYIYLNWEHAVINETTDLIHKFTKKSADWGVRVSLSNFLCWPWDRRQVNSELISMKSICMTLVLKTFWFLTVVHCTACVESKRGLLQINFSSFQFICICRHCLEHEKWKILAWISSN